MSSARSSKSTTTRAESNIRSPINRPLSTTAINLGSPPKTAASKPNIHSKPSDRLNPKTTDPFNKKPPKSIFVATYVRGGIPCRLCHGSVKHKIEWTQPPEHVHFDPVIVLLAEGLKETEFPYGFIAREGFGQLLQVEDARRKTIPVLPKLITPIKTALILNNNESFQSALQAIVQLSEVIGNSLNIHLKTLLPQISRRYSNNRNQREKIASALQTIEMNGGPECTPIIKSRIPTYTSVL